MNKLDNVFVSSSYRDSSIIFRKDEIINTYEQDWDDDSVFFRVDPSGKIVKIHLDTGDVYEYNMERVVR